MIPIYRRYYQAGLVALAVTGKATLVYDVPADASLSAWDSILISSVLCGWTYPASFNIGA